MYGEGLLKQFLAVDFLEPGDYRGVYQERVKFEWDPLKHYDMSLRFEYTSPFPRLKDDHRYRIYPFPGYDLRLGRGVRMAVSLRRPDRKDHSNEYYPSWFVAPPIDGGRWEPVYKEDDMGRPSHRDLKHRIQLLCLLFYEHRDQLLDPVLYPEQPYFWVEATVYQRILEDTASGAGLYAKVNLRSEGIPKIGEPSATILSWSPEPVVELGKNPVEKFKRMVRLAELATQKDEVFLEGKISPLDAPFLIAASEEQLPRYREGRFKNGTYPGARLEMSVVIDYERLRIDPTHDVSRLFQMPETEIWGGITRCFPNESVLVEIS